MDHRVTATASCSSGSPQFREKDDRRRLDMYRLSRLRGGTGKLGQTLPARHLTMIRWLARRRTNGGICGERGTTIALILLVELLAVTPALREDQVRSGQLLSFLVLALISIAYSELTRRSGRLGVALKDGKTPNLLSAMTFAGAILLPPPLIVTTVAVAYAAEWKTRRAYGARVHRHIYTAASVICACQAAHVLVQTVPGALGLPLAAIVSMAINIGLVIAALLLANQRRVLEMFRSVRGHAMVSASHLIGIGTAYLATWHLPLCLLALPLLMAVQRLLLSSQITETKAIAADGVWSREGWMALAREAHAAKEWFSVLLADASPAQLGLLRARLVAEVPTDSPVGVIGEQLVILMRGATAAAAELYAGDLAAELAREGMPVSIGIAECKRAGQPLSAVLVEAASDAVIRGVADRTTALS